MSAAAGGPATNSAMPPALILFGLDEGRKPHASTFTEDLVDKALAAGEAMGMAALKLETDDARSIAAQLPAGKIFDSGNAFVPFVKATVYEQLVKQLPDGVEAPKPRPPKVKAQKPGVPPATFAKLPEGTEVKVATDWSSFALGSMVLANDPDEDGWFECVVVELGQNDTFWLKWRDWPELDNIVRHRSQIGLLPPPPSSTPAK